MTFSSPIEPSEALLLELRQHDRTFNKVFDIKAPVEVWDTLIEDLRKPEYLRTVNGCGSQSTEFVPDTLWGLCITPVCHIHDVMCIQSKTPEDCELTNKLFLENMMAHIKQNSNWFMAIVRNYRAMTYYNAVQTARKQFCRGYRS